MEKPTIFFSHSTQDAHILERLKEALLEITGKTIRIFLSSDGKSIPLGTNWVSETVGALDKTSLMFVFVSPNSLNSKWLYFESGYSFSKDAKVTPVGINGVDIGKIGPPLSLLQGFNIDHYKKLNNIIAKINSNYDTGFKEDFTEKIFNEIFAPHLTEDITSISQFIDEATTTFHLPGRDKLDLKEYLEKKGVKFSIKNTTLYLHGAQLIFENYPTGEFNSSLNVTPTKLFQLKEIIHGIISMHDKPELNIEVNLVISDGFSLQKNHEIISEKLENHIELIEDVYRYKDLFFSFKAFSGSSFSSLDSYYNPKTTISIQCNAEEFDLEQIRELLKLCTSKALITPKEIST